LRPVLWRSAGLRLVLSGHWLGGGRVLASGKTFGCFSASFATVASVVPSFRWSVGRGLALVSRSARVGLVFFCCPVTGFWTVHGRRRCGVALGDGGLGVCEGRDHMGNRVGE